MPRLTIQVNRLTFLSLLACLLSSLSFTTTHAATLTFDETIDARTSARVFDDAWKTINERYYDANFNGADWQRMRAELRSLAVRARTGRELYGVLRRLTAALADSHTRAFPPGESDDWRRTRFTDTGVRLVEAEGGLFVASITENSSAQQAGVRGGDEVISIDNRAWQEVLRSRANDAPGASTSRINRLQLVRRLLDGEAGTSVELTIANAKGRTRVVRLTRTRGEARPELRITSLGDGAYKVAFNIFTEEIVATLARELRRGQLKRATSLVFDLRANGGGDAEAMIDVLSIFLPPNENIGRFVDRKNRTTSVLRTRHAMLSAAERGTRFRGSLILLTGTATASAAEIFVASLKRARRINTIVIGETTCGCVLAIRRRHRLPDGGTLDVSELDYRTSDDRRLEGTGITPDETVTLKRDDILANRDPALARARQHLKQQTIN